MSRPKRLRPRFRSTLSVTVAGFSLLCTLDARAQTAVYRCTTPSGEIEFSQQVCDAGSEEKEITIKEQRTGWEPAKTKIEREGSKARNESRAAPREAAAKKRAEEQKQADKCWEKEQKLDELSWKLRRGYSASQGVKLRRKRRDYEEYLSRYCE